MQVQIREENVDWLEEHARISIAFKVESVLDLTLAGQGLGGFCLSERQLNEPYVKDYDILPNCHPSQWRAQFDMSTWGFFSARVAGEAVGGAVVAWQSPSCEMLEGRSDLAVLWDIRVAPAMRRRGIAAQLFAAAEQWAQAHGCRQLKVETQNVNVPACRFYARKGFELGAIHRFAYRDLPDEIQLLWYKTLVLEATFVHHGIELLRYGNVIPPLARPNMPSTSVAIRVARLDDLPTITEIYNEAILTTTATFDTEPKTLDERLEWFQSHDERHPVLVAVLAGQIVGWASISKWSERQAYDDTAETSFYVKSECRGRGIGRRLKQAIIAEARRLRFHTLIARVAEGSDASLHLSESCGFVHVGTLREAGHKFGRLLDVHVLQIMLD